MQTKPSYQSTTKLYHFEYFRCNFPTAILVDATLEAQHRALVTIEGLERNAARVELFWVVYNVEFRQYIERWAKANALRLLG